MDRNGDGYLSGKQVAAALREAGYDLSDSDVQNVLNGFGSDEYGRVDVTEFVQALHDIASGNDWYQQDYVIPTSSTGNISAQTVNKSGEFMFGTLFNGLQTGYEGKWDGFDAQREPNLVEAALKEIVEQMSLIDVSRLPGYGGGNRAAAIMRPFRICDKGSKVSATGPRRDELRKLDLGRPTSSADTSHLTSYATRYALRRAT